MTTLPENAEWVGVYQLEESDPVVGGAPNEATGAGMDNIPHLHLTRRTAWLRAQHEALASVVAGLASALAALAAQVVAATTTTAGIVRLNNTLTSTAQDQALTAAQGKVLNDGKAPLASPALTGTPTAPTAQTSDNSDRIATTNWVRSAMATIASSAGFAASLGANGYVRLPSWLGGLILQWGSATISTSPRDVTLPIAFPTAHLQALVTESGAGLLQFGAAPQTLSTVRIWTNNTSAATARFLCIGY